MTIGSGTRLGPYEIVSPIGVGGMGEVYRARDTRLGRSVAIKIIPGEFAKNAQLRLRFEREARTISQLNHPHICALYDVGENYFVMELLEGETLADRLGRGALPLNEVLTCGAQIAAALDKAHKAGVVHRDLKPGNIMITRSGAKLLDFGLAKGGVVAVGGEGSTALRPLTAEGAIVGTFQYMAPEQLEGGEADARTDIFALGAVLYEMATGKRAFQGKTRTSLIAAIVTGEPVPLSQVQPLAPASLEIAIRKCLAKDPDDRWQCAADLRWALLQVPQQPAEGAPVRRTSRLAWSIAAASLIAAATLALLLVRPAQPARVVRFSISPPAGWSFGVNYNLGPPAMSPDGRYLVIPSTDDLTGRSMLWLRDLAASDVTPLAGSEGAGFPFWSPDSASIGFFAGGYLKRIDLSGGSPQVLCSAPLGRGGSWSRNNEILFAPSGNGVLYRVSARGGDPQQVTRLDSSRQERSHRWPLFLPDGKHFLFLIRRPSSADRRGDGIYVASIDSPAPRLILEVSSNLTYASDDLLYVRDRTLVAQHFNPRTLQLEGEPRVVIRDRVPYHPAGFGLFSASRSGVLAYGAGSLVSRIEWMDRAGHTEPVTGSAADYNGPRLSADQKRLVYSLPDPTSGNLDLWIYDLERHVSRRVTFHPRDELSGLLTPDGTQVVYASNRGGFPDVFIQSVDAPDEKVLLSKGLATFPESISADAKSILVREVSERTQNDILVLSRKDGTVTPLLNSPFNEVQSVFSPTSRWIAYTSNESGRYEVYTCRFPGGGSRTQISTDGGSQPTWRGDEKELFYIAPGGWITSVPIDTTSGVLKPGTPARVTQVVLHPARDEEREYDVAADGRRFLINSSLPDKASPAITVLVNWQAELDRK